MKDDLSEALEECRRTYVPNKIPPRLPGDFACLLPEYLAARRRYHTLLVEAGLLDPRLADKPNRQPI